MKNNERDQEFIDYDQIEIVTTFAPDTEFEGDLTFSTPLKIQGKFKGQIETKSFLWIDIDAIVEGIFMPVALSWLVRYEEISVRIKKWSS